MKEIKEKRRKSIMMAVRGALKTAKVYLPPEALQKLEAALQPGWYHIRILHYSSEAEAELTCCEDCRDVDPDKETYYDDFLDTVYGNVTEEGVTTWYRHCRKEECDGCNGDCNISYDYDRCTSPVFVGTLVFIKKERWREVFFNSKKERHGEVKTIFVYAPKEQSYERTTWNERYVLERLLERAVGTLSEVNFDDRELEDWDRFASFELRDDHLTVKVEEFEENPNDLRWGGSTYLVDSCNVPLSGWDKLDTAVGDVLSPVIAGLKELAVKTGICDIDGFIKFANEHPDLRTLA